MTLIDRFVVELDKGVRTVFGTARAARPSPAGAIPDAALSLQERRAAAALMRVNHCGEVCAQALYQGQTLAAKDSRTSQTLAAAAREEEDHLSWTQARITELGGRVSLLTPVWYASSLAIGYVAGRFGNRWSLGFLKETERQVEAHLEGHLDRIPRHDARTRAVIAQMKEDERRHADTAAALGAAELPAPVRQGMKAASKVMTTIAYWV